MKLNWKVVEGKIARDAPITNPELLINSLAEDIVSLHEEIERLKGWLSHWEFCAWWHEQGNGASEGLQKALAGEFAPHQKPPVESDVK